jgi:hypothetical protein
MVKGKHRTVEEILGRADDDQKNTTERIRALVKDTFPTAEEIVRQGRITYTLKGRDFSGLRIANGHVDLIFPVASSLSSAQLKGQGSIGDPKHIEVRTLKNFDQKEAVRLLKEAAALV